jgi:hypothetical protein
MMARIKTFSDLMSGELDVFYLAAANFSQLMRTKKGKVVVICHECLLCLTNMDTKTDALRVHCAMNPKCTFISRELTPEQIIFICETSDLMQLLPQHFYLYKTILNQNPNIIEHMLL